MQRRLAIFRTRTVLSVQMASRRDAFQIEFFHLLPSPRCFAQKSQARRKAGVFIEAPDMDALPHLLPAIVRYQMLEDGLQGFAVLRIIGLGFFHQF